MSTHSPFEADNDAVYGGTDFGYFYAHRRESERQEAAKTDPVKHLHELRSQIAETERQKTNAEFDLRRAESAIKETTDKLRELNKTFEEVKKQAVAMITEMTPK
jgi:hypothetical protein